MKKRLTDLRSFRASLIVGVAVLSACSDSYLFDPPPPEGPGAPNGGLPVQQIGPQDPGASPAPSASGLSLTLDADPTLVSDDVYQLLFPNQSVDPFDVQNSDPTVEMKMTLKSESTDDKRNENYVEMKVTLTMKLKSGKTLKRQLVSDGNVTLKNINNGNSNVDVMDGYLKEDGIRKGRRFLITAQRTGSADESSARKNAWSGRLMLEKGSKTPQLGRFEGFAEMDGPRSSPTPYAQPSGYSHNGRVWNAPTRTPYAPGYRIGNNPGYIR